MNNEISKLREILNQGEIVFFGGAGVSTESNIPDFRSEDGLYNQKYDYPVEVILSHSFFMKKPKEFYRFYMDKLIGEGYLPNTAHKVLARLENEGKLISIVTQNIDGLHQMAGSRNVYELHGSTYRNYCMKCHKKYGINDMLKFKKEKVELPTCECGGIIKPDVVLYEEGLSEEVLEGSIDSIRVANTLIVAGTSLTVYPAAGLIRYFNGDNLVLINRDSTSVDKNADLVIHDSVGKVLEEAYGLV